MEVMVAFHYGHNRKTEVESRKYFTLWWEVLLKSLRGSPYRFWQEQLLSNG